MFTSMHIDEYRRGRLQLNGAVGFPSSSNLVAHDSHHIVSFYLEENELRNARNECQAMEAFLHKMMTVQKWNDGIQLSSFGILEHKDGVFPFNNYKKIVDAPLDLEKLLIKLELEGWL